ncbi:MAG: hypothetical protein ABIB71_08765 [Candidatus Woesearchaeota archaeon]
MKKAIMIAVMALLLVNIASALTVEVTPGKTAFKEGDILSFDYSITSDSNQDIFFVPEISCHGNVPSSFFIEESVSLEAGKKYSASFSSVKVDQEAEPQECVAKVLITSPTVEKYETKIKVETKPSMNIQLKACEDSVCTKSKRTFVKGSTIYLKSNSKAVNAVVIFPDKTRKSVRLPGSFVAAQPGKYKIEVSALQTGYKSYSSIEHLTVIKEAVTIPYAKFSKKFGKAVVRPKFEGSVKVTPPEMKEAPVKVEPKTEAVKTTPKKTSRRVTRSFFSRITGFLARIF